MPGPPAAEAPTTQSREARYGVFLSHSSRDKATVERIARALKDAGIEPWLDKWHLTPGADWQSEIAAGIRSSRSCAVFVGEEGLGDWERQELGLALDRAAKDRHFRVFPVLLPGVSEPFDPTRLPPFISTRTWVDFRGGFNDRRVFQRLVKAVLGIPLGAEEEHAPRPQVCPYRGLRTFDEEHAEFFFGRDADVQRLLERIKEQRFLTVLGPSGSGKSSLVRAGLLPAIRRGALPGSDMWRVVVFRPGAEPLTTLAAQLLDLFPDRAMQSTVDLLQSDERSLHLAVAQGTASRTHEERIVWVLDQFEEVFTLCRDQAQRRALFANALHAAFAPGGRCYIVITMRADFYPKCAAYPELAQAISANQFLAWPMEEWALAQAIEEPARAVGLELEEGLTDQVLADLRQAPGALPLMEHTLLELWERRRGTMLTLEAYREAGGVAGSLAKRADLVYESLPEAERAVAKRVLLRLTQPGEGTEDTRRRAAFDELVGAGEERDAVEHVVSSLTHARLLTTGTDESSGGRVVDVSHEALIRGWPRLREWLDEDRTGLRIHRRLTEAAQEWARLGRDADALYRGVRLAQTSEWAERNSEALNELEAAFLRESIDAQERARRRRQRGVRTAVGALAAGLVVVGVLALLALAQKERADEQGRLARSRELAATSLEQLDRDPQLSVLLAIEAYETAPTAQAEAALRRALVSSHLRRVLAIDAPGEPFFEVSPDGELIATSSPEGSVVLWELGSGERLAALQDPQGTAAPPEENGPDEKQLFFPLPSFSPDGRLLFSGQPDGSAVIWSVPDRRLVTPLDQVVGALGWTPDGRSVLTLGADEIVRLRDATTGEVQAEFRPSTPPLGGPGPPAALSPDGRNVAMNDGSNLRIVRVSTGRTTALVKGSLWAFSPDGQRLVAGEEDGMARVVDVASGRIVRALDVGVDVGGLAYEAAFSPDGSKLLTGHEGGARIWDVDSGQRLELTGHGAAVWNVAFSPDGRIALTASEDSTARLWDPGTGRVLAVLAGHAGPIQWATFTPDGRSVVTAGPSARPSIGEVRLWEVGSGETATLHGHEAPVTGARFSPDGRSIISAGVDGTARAWDVATERQTFELRPPGAPGSPVAVLFAEFGGDAGLGVIWGHRASQDRLPEEEPVRLWDVGNGKVRTEFPTPPDDGTCFLGACPFTDAALSPDGSRLATVGEDGVLRLWDAARGNTLETMKLGGTASGVEWTPDGTRIIALAEPGNPERFGQGQGGIVVVEATTFQKIRGFGPRTGPQTHAALEPSADGSLVAVGYSDRTARVWEVATGRLVAELLHAGPVFDVGFSPDGRFLVTASRDAPTIWDLESQRPLVELFGHTAGVFAVEFSPDGSSILSAGADETIRIWRCEVCAPIDQLLELARKRALRDLTPAERAKFLHEAA